jgi:hypothetical protein
MVGAGACEMRTVQLHSVQLLAPGEQLAAPQPLPHTS